MSNNQAERLVRAILLQIGEDPDREGLRKTPERVVRSWAAGWSGGQLEDEMRRKAWLSFPASLELVFDTPPERLWAEVLNRKGGWLNKIRAQMPEDLSWN